MTGAASNIVGNFSAHKHVRSEKDIYSVEALLQNNVLHAKRPPRLADGVPAGGILLLYHG